MDAFSNPAVEQVVFKKSARVGWSKILSHVIGYSIHHDPCSMLLVQPTVEDAEGFSKDDVAVFLAETPALAALVSEAKSRDSNNTILKKNYPGGSLHLCGANSPRGFRRITVKRVLFDETDGYPPSAGTEGDQIALGSVRAETYPDKVIGIGSTPTVEDISRVHAYFQSSSRGFYVVACPHCGGEHVRRFRASGYGDDPTIIRGEPFPEAFLHWEHDDPRTAAWCCPDCGALHGYEHHRRQMENGYWRGDDWEWRDGEFTFYEGFQGRIGFYLWAGYSYSPSATPARIVRKFLDAKHNEENLKTFVNTTLGECWRETGEQMSEHVLLRRRENYKAEVPQGGVVLTAGADIQPDRIELEVVAWGAQRESWNVDMVVFWGDAAGDEVWGELKEFVLDTRYQHESGVKLGISALCVDSGYLQKRVQQFIGDFGKGWAWMTKGVSGTKRAFTESRDARQKRLRKRKAAKGQAKPELIGVDEGKLWLYRALRVKQAGPRYCHFPLSRDEEYFAQLTGERLITRYRNGRPLREWKAMRARVEAQDCRLLALAALILSDIDLEKARATVDGLRSKKAAPRRRPSRPSSGGHGFGPEGWSL